MFGPQMRGPRLTVLSVGVGDVRGAGEGVGGHDRVTCPIIARVAHRVVGIPGHGRIPRVLLLGGLRGSKGAR